MSTIGDFYGIFKVAPNLGGEYSILKSVSSGGASSTGFIDQSSFFFDGIDDSLQSQTSFTSLDGQGYVGISLWIKIPDVSLANENIIKINNSVSGYSFLAFVRTTGQIDASCVSGSSYTRSNTGAITDNTWHHVFFRLDFSLNRYSILTIFVDGVENNSGSNFSSLASFPNNSSTMFIATNGSTAYSNVYVNELAFYTSGDDTLPSQIYNNGTANDLNTANNYEPLVWYRSEDGTWNGREWEIPDKNQNGVNLLSFNLTESSRVGDFPFAETSSFFYDGVDEYFKGSATLEALNGGVTKATFSVWIKPTQASFRYVFQNPRNTTIQHSQFAMFFDDNLRTRWSMDTQSYYIFSNLNALVVDEWNHVLICVDLTQVGGADRGRVFINGVNETATVNLTTRNQFSDAVGEFHIGEDAESYQSSALGGIDEMALWSGQDLRADYLTIYNQGLPVNLNNLSGISQPTNWWRSETATYPQYSTLSFNFDGVDDSFSANVVNTSAQVSVSFWYKGSGGTTQNILGGNGGGFFQYFGLLGADSRLFVYNGGVWKALTINTIRDNQWHHCVVTYDRNLQEVKGYRDGSLEVTLSSFVDRTDVGFQQIGRYVTAIRYLTGNLDELSMFNEVLTDSQVTDIYNGGTPNDLSSLNPFVWYRLGEGAVWDGTNWTLNDFGTNRVNATSSNMVEANRQTDFPVNNNGQFTMPSFNNAYDVLSQNMVEGSQSPNVPNFNNKSFTFDGVDDYVNVGTSSLGITNAISVSAWVKIPTSNTGGGGTNIQVIACEDTTSGGQRNWNMFWRGTGFNYFAWAIHHTNLSFSSVTTTGITPNDGQWHHLLGTYDGTTNANGIKLYVDGVLNVQGTAGSTGINAFSSSEPTIGALTGGASWRFEGNIDEVAIWNSDQSSNITSIYNQGVPNDISTLNPLSWWRMGENASWDGTNWTLNDLGSGSNNGTSANMTQASRTFDVPRYSQNSFEFDSSLSQSLDGTTNYTLAEGRSQMTISAWVDMSNSGNSSLTYLCYVYNSVFSFGVRLQTTTSTILWFYSGTAGNNARASANLGQIKGRGWQHLLICVDLTKPNFTEVQVYLNGVAQSMSGYFTQTTFNSVSAPLIIGEDNTGATFYNGYIDEFAIWIDEDLRLQSKVDEIYNGGIPNNLNALTSVPSPTTWFRMGEQKSTWNGSKWILESLSYSTNSFFFDGVDDIFETNSIYSQLNGGTKLTLSVWIKPISGAPTLEYIISNPRDALANNSQFALVLYEGNSISLNVQSRTSQYVSGRIGAITYGAWNHILVCVDLDRTIGTEGIIFINGVDETTTSAMGTLTSFYNATDVLHIGIDANGGFNRYNGYLDEVAIWSGQDLRDSTSVETIYNQGVPNNLNENGLTAPTTYYRMGEDATFDGTNWNIVDNGSSGINATSQNMSLASKTDDVSGTYTLDSVNMVEANKSDNNPD